MQRPSAIMPKPPRRVQNTSTSVTTSKGFAGALMSPAGRPSIAGRPCVVHSVARGQPTARSSAKAATQAPCRDGAVGPLGAEASHACSIGSRGVTKRRGAGRPASRQGGFAGRPPPALGFGEGRSRSRPSKRLHGTDQRHTGECAWCESPSIRFWCSACARCRRGRCNRPGRQERLVVRRLGHALQRGAGRTPLFPLRAAD